MPFNYSSEIAQRVRNIFKLGGQEIQKEILDQLLAVGIINTSEEPVFSAIVERGKLTSQAQTTNAGGGTVTHTYTVPSGKKWILKSGYTNISAGTLNYFIMRVQAVSGTNSYVRSVQPISGFTDVDIFINQPIVISQGSKVVLVVNSTSVPAIDHTTTLMYLEFDEVQ